MDTTPAPHIGTPPTSPDQPSSSAPPRTPAPPPSPARPASPAPARRLRILLLLGTLSSLISAALGLRWLLVPESAVLGASAVPPPLLELVGAGPLYTAQLAVALLGAVAGLLGLSRPASPLLAVAGALQVAVFGLGFASFLTLAATGYLIALAMPLLLLTIGVLLVLHGGRARWAVGLPLLVVLALAAVAGTEVIAHLATLLLPAVLSQGGAILTTAHFVVAGAVWAALCGAVLHRTGRLQRIGAWTVRRRRGLTLFAACGPLPYALVRLTWLTPWPLLGGEMAAADLSTRVWGLTLSLGAWLGALLTIGLIRPWGEVFPRWFPLLGGRPVPVAVAAVPGFTIAALLCFAAAPMVLGASTLGLASMLEFALIFPCWFWGPMLALAVSGYVGHRASTIDSRAEGVPSARMAG